MLGKEARRARRLSAQRCGAAGDQEQQNKKRRTRNFSAEGHPTPFKNFDSEPTYRIAETSQSVASRGPDQSRNSVGGAFDGARRAKPLAHLRQSSTELVSCV
jgi:hypothetical protein